LIKGSGTANFWNYTFTAPDTGCYLVAGFMFIIMGFSGLLLLTKKAKNEFKRKRNKPA